MKEIEGRVSYIKGLMDGLNIDKECKEGKIFTEILNLINDLALDMDSSHDDLEEYIDSVDSELSVIKRDYYDLDEAIGDIEEEDVEEEYCEVQCDSCNEVIYVEKNLLEEDNSIPCPFCQHEIQLKKK
ncbi:CD1247 N-terminal domain-containing protein [Clostridium frigidicarnis]|uniref:Uncharacterized protein n=1 Tax=Clostridium frigidicarnis TaxID=84698 RepID=A0A1I0WI07_9CLOT|nr:CD1247 N-terminal domain-containing protein [Clostridium frigidicarnis]SFA87868.1 hypothetical protein SAMN04488528_100584 [Clostridium frigidicarnis]